MPRYQFSSWLVVICAIFLFSSANVTSNSLDDNVKITTADVGSLKSDFQVTPTGQARYSIPIDVAPGTAGMAPALSIAYDSASSNSRNGLLGMGFSLGGLTAITRCSSNKTQDGLIRGVDFSDQDKFCLSGEKLVAIKGKYGADGTEYRTYNDNKIKVVSYGRQGNGPASFKIWTKGGQIAEYGLTTDSQVKAQGKDTVTVWGLNRIQDIAGNYLDVHYFKDEGKGIFHATEINYTGNEKAKLAPYNSVQFIYEERPDANITYQAGSKITLNKRLKAIQAYQSSTLVYEYRFTYEISKNTLRSRITSIQKCTGSGICLPATKFEWQTNEEGWVEAPDFVLPTDVSISGKDDGVRILDVNGDGLPDLVHGSDQKPHQTWINTGKGWLENKNFILPTNILEDGKDAGVRILDINGDGLSDIVQGSDKNLRKIWINTGKDWSDNTYSNFVLPMDILVEGKDDGVRFLDLNGDGLLDIVQVIPVEETNWKGAEGAHTNKYDFIYTFDEAEKKGEFKRHPRGWTIIYDVEDAAFIYRGDKLDSSRKPYATWINNQDNWVQGINLHVDQTVSRIAPYSRGAMFLDLNGDGLTDLISAAAIGENKQRFTLVVGGKHIDGDEQRSTWMNIGKRGWMKSNFTLPANMLINGRYTGLKFLDLNGDGLPDIIQSYIDGNKRETHRSWFNTGNSWEENSNFVLPINFSENGQDTGIEILDLNGDGLPDIVQNYVDGNKKETHEVWLNTGTGWVKNSSFNLPLNNASEVQYLDLNGDGLLDCILTTSIDGKVVRKAYLNKALKLPDYLVSVTDGFGAKLDISYESLSGEKKDEVYAKEHNARYPDIDWQGPMYVVSKTSCSSAMSDPEAIAHVTTYNYTGAKFNHLGLGFLGFHTVTSVDQSSGINTTTTYSQNIELHIKGLPTAVETRLANGTLIASSKDTWEVKIFGEERLETTYYSPYLKQSIKKSYGLDGRLISTTGIDNTIDKYGNPIKIISSVQDAETREVYTTMTVNAYHSNPKKWILGELLTAQITKILPNGSEQKRASTFIYDPNTSLLIQTIAEPNNPRLALKTQYTRDVFGNIITTTVSGKRTEPVLEQKSKVKKEHSEDECRSPLREPFLDDAIELRERVTPRFQELPQDRVHLNPEAYTSSSQLNASEEIEPITTRVKYDNYGRFVVQTTNHLNHSVYQTFDPRFGVVIESIDANGLKTSYQYDDFARLVGQIDPDGARANVTYSWFNLASVNQSEIKSILKQASYVITRHTKNGTTENEYYDILDRKVASTTQNMDGKAIWQLVGYDEFGRVTKTALPFFEGDQVYYHKMHYDVLGRVIKNILPDNSSTKIIYDGFTTTAINQLKQKQIKKVNAIGEVVKTIDNLGGVTNYKYDAYGNMIEMTDNSNNITQIKYDNLGRKIAIHDEDKGNWSYQYDVLGNLISQTDALNQTTIFKYDQLNRMVSRTEYAYTDKAIISTWEYDVAPNGIGKLTKSSSVVDEKGKTPGLMLIQQARSNGIEAHTRTLTYDLLGRISQDKTMVQDRIYIHSYIYDQNGRVETEIYPNGLRVKNNYNELGYLVQINDAQTGKVYWSLNAKDAAGHIVSESHSNGLITNYTYDPKTQFLTDIDTVLGLTLSTQKDLLPEFTGVTATHQHIDKPASSTASVQKEIFKYDLIGNIITHQDTINNVFENFQYDQLNRLTKADGIGIKAQVLRYEVLSQSAVESSRMLQ